MRLDILYAPFFLKNFLVDSILDEYSVTKHLIHFKFISFHLFISFESLKVISYLLKS